jgi:hypothetical protein
MHKKKSSEESKRQLFSLSVPLSETDTLSVVEMVTGDVRVSTATITKGETSYKVERNEIFLRPKTFAKLNEIGLRWLLFAKERERKEIKDGQKKE